MTITKAITLDGGGGQVASVLVSGTNGIIVSAGANDIVILRNLRINGIGSGLNGVLFNSGAQLSVENCDIFGFTQSGISANTSTVSDLYVTNTYITNSVNGISLATSSAGMLVVIDRTRVFNVTTNGIGVNSGLIDTEVTNTAITSAATGVIVSGGSTRANVDTSSISTTPPRSMPPRPARSSASPTTSSTTTRRTSRSRAEQRSPRPETIG